MEEVEERGEKGEVSKKSEDKFAGDPKVKGIYPNDQKIYHHTKRHTGDKQAG